MFNRHWPTVTFESRISGNRPLPRDAQDGSTPRRDSDPEPRVILVETFDPVAEANTVFFRRP